MNEENLPLYEVEEVTLEEAILLLADENENYPYNYQASSERLMQLVA